MSYNLKEPSSQDFEHPPPLALVQDEGDRMGSPIIPNMENSEADIIPIIPSPGYQPDIFGAPLVGSNSGQNHGHGSREGESRETPWVCSIRARMEAFSPTKSTAVETVVYPFD